ncbi:MAG: helix-turn-helix domain-containing protein [Planctomycetota bacterium]|nr:helix-turn-helix domain-containing protein [Planctomycetota bacterium]
MTDRAPKPAAPAEPGPPCLALRPKDAAKAIGISERKLWALTNDRSSGIPHVKLGAAIVYPVRELMDWLRQQAEGGAR